MSDTITTDSPRRGPGRPSRAEMEAARNGGEGRRQRVPLGTRQQRLGATGLPPGTVGRWINDTGDRLARAQQAGYDFVPDTTQAISGDVGSRKSQVVGTHANGEPMRAYLMAIPREFYEEDQAVKRQEIEAKEAPIKDARAGQDARAPEGADPSDRGAFYTPKQGTSYAVR